MAPRFYLPMVVVVVPAIRNRASTAHYSEATSFEKRDALLDAGVAMAR
jgi:hypothetical protein